MNSLLSKLNIFLLMIWGETVVLISSMIFSGIFMNLIYELFYKKFTYKFYESLKISLTLFIIVVIQFLYKNILDIFLRKKIMKITFAINSMFFSILLSNKIIKKTILSKYPIFYFFLFIAMLTPFLDDIIKITKSRIKKQYE